MLFLFLPYIIINIIIYINIIFIYINIFFKKLIFKIKNIITIFFITGWNITYYNFGKRNIGIYELPWLASI